MKRPELDAILLSMLGTTAGISDINFSVGRAPQVEAFGVLREIDVAPHIKKLTPFQTERVALNIMGSEKRLYQDLAQKGSCDCSYSVSGQVRFRVNIFRNRGNLSIVNR
jgi:twitching motility protein PilT